jgi:uncharacterized membrane protein YbhN (UPF0104 family)
VSAVTDALASVFSSIGDVDGRWLAPALLLHLANHVLRSVAWRNVLAAAYPARRVPLLTVASAYAVGVGLNALLPGRGGDAAKVALLRGGLPGSSVATIASTMSVLVLFDLVAATLLVLALALGGAVPFAPSPPSAPGWLGDHLLLAAGALVAGACLLALVLRRLRRPLGRLWAQAQVGGAILRTPSAYVHRVALVQAGAWCCRIGVVFSLLAAFGLPASISGAALVMVLTGASTLVPLTPGGAGTQQVVLAYVLSERATTAAVLAFSVGMQAGITAVNAVLGVTAAMVAFRTLRPLSATRSMLRLARSG